MSPTYISAAVIVLVQVLHFFNIDVGSAELTTTLTTLSTVALSLWIMWRRLNKGDITAVGTKKA